MPWTEILKFASFGFFWFVMQFLAILLSTSHDAPKKTEAVNHLIFVGVPLVLLLGYKIYTIIKNDLNWPAETFRFLLIIVLPLVLSRLYIVYGGPR